MRHRRDTSFTADKLRTKYPDLAEVFEQILSDRRDMYGAASVNYFNKYEGRSKGVSLGLIETILEENGYDIEILIKKR